ncbi:hypothetical protein ABHC57_18070 [Parabacteroides merdae]|nr:hypothetical protein [Parabacteroides merdae]RGM96534.1 hypothetical protein DXB85_12655 [Parabacteroides merdae]
MQKYSICPAMANKSGRLSKESTQNPTTKNNRIFYFPPCKDSPASCVPVQGQAPSGLAERKSSSLRCGIFFRQALPQSPENRLERHQEIKMPTHVGRCFT